MEVKKALFSFKPVDYMKNPHMFAGIAEIDLASGEIGRVLRIPAATFKSKHAFMANFIQGLCSDEKYIYASGWNFVVIVDLSDFRIVDSFSMAEMADVHSLSVDNESIYVISTATECLICVDKKTLKKKWVWGPNEKILNYDSTGFLPPFSNSFYRKGIRKLNLRKYVITPKYQNEETRYVHKTTSPYYRHHLNNVYVTDEFIYLNTKGWFNSKNSSVIKIKKQTRESSFFAKPGTFIGSHDGVIHKGHYYVTEADNNSVSRVNLNGSNLERFELEPKGYFVRGILLTGDVNFVGFTPLKNGDDSCKIISYNKDFSRKIKEFVLPDLCGHKQKTAVHTIIQF